MSSAPKDQACLTRALTYPYPAPAARDFLFDGGQTQALREDFDFSGRLPVLAVGSNRSPEQLRRKYGSDACECIPVTSLTLPDHDVAYCAYVTHYGSVPATLVSAPDVSVSVAVTWLSEEQLALMHSTESVGDHTMFGTIDVPGVSSAGQRLDILHTYVSQRDLLGAGSAPTPLAAIQAHGRNVRPLTQRDVLHWVFQQDTRNQSPFEDWLLAVIDDADYRTLLNIQLSRTAIRSPLASFRCINLS